MEIYIRHFLNFLAVERGLAQNTIISYALDLKQFKSFCVQRQVKDAGGIDRNLVLNYLLELKKMVARPPQYHGIWRR